MSQHLGDFPTYAQMEEHNRLYSIIAHSGTSPSVLDSIVTASCDGTNTTRLFWSWYTGAQANHDTKYDLLCRFFTALAKGWADKTYTLRWYNYAVSSDPTMTPMDDLSGKTAAPLCNAASEDTFHWMDEDPMYWYIRANALSNADGTMNVLAIEGESDFDVTGTSAPVYTFKMAKWVKEWESGSYNYISWRTTEAAGFRPYAGDVGLDNEKRPMMWTPTFPGGLNPSTGGLTSGAGLRPAIWISTTDGLTKARITNAAEGLWCDQDTLAVLHDWQFRHYNLENSGILEGCTNYYYDYTPAIAETNTNRVILTTAQGNSLVVGSTIELAETSRTSSAASAEVFLKRISAIEEVVIDNTTYSAVYIDNDGNTFNTTTTQHFTTMPWYSGSTETIPGHKDGCLASSFTNAKYAIRVGGVELMDGAYTTGLDPLYNVTATATEGEFDYAVYECKNSENLASSITANYVDTGLRLNNIKNQWYYIKAFNKNQDGLVWPEVLGGDSSHWYKSAFAGSYSAGVRVPSRFGNLYNTGFAGLACLYGSSYPSYSDWGIRPRLSGSGKKRGEWQA